MKLKIDSQNQVKKKNKIKKNKIMNIYFIFKYFNQKFFYI